MRRTPQIDAIEISHVIQRAWERYRVHLLMADLGKLEQQCRSGRAVLAKRQPGGGEHRLVRHDGKMMRAVWVPEIGRIVTFLPVSSRDVDRPALRGHVKSKPSTSGPNRNGSRAKRRPRPERKPDIDLEDV